MSNITATVLEDIQNWQSCPLAKRYAVIPGRTIREAQTRHGWWRSHLFCHGHRRRGISSNFEVLRRRPREFERLVGGPERLLRP